MHAALEILNSTRCLKFFSDHNLLFRFGTDQNDTMVPPYLDDVSDEFSVPIPIVFFQSKETKLYVSLLTKFLVHDNF